jgi:hypothetical protein
VYAAFLIHVLKSTIAQVHPSRSKLLLCHKWYFNDQFVDDFA